MERARSGGESEEEERARRRGRRRRSRRMGKEGVVGACVDAISSSMLAMPRCSPAFSFCAAELTEATSATWCR